MANVALEIDDSDVRRMLASSPAKLDRAMRGAMNDATALLLRDLQTYPPERSGQTYRRTRTLGRAWSREITGQGLDMTGIVGSNGNMAPYNREVQDYANQAKIHRGRWPTIQGVTANRERTIQGMFDARFRQELEG
jgi:hypothetical protein